MVAEFDVKEYDIAAAVPIIAEAGGRLTSFDGAETISARSTLATNGVLHDAFLDFFHASPDPSRRILISPDAPPPESRTMTPLHRLGAALAIAAAMTVVTACAAPAPAPSALPTIEPSGANTPPPASEAAETPVPGAEPTCETIIPAATVADFESLAWSAEEEEFRVGPTVVEGGIQCVWADHSGPATDHVQIFGWAPDRRGRRRRRPGVARSPRAGCARSPTRASTSPRTPRRRSRTDSAGLRHDLPLRRRLGEGRRHQAGPAADHLGRLTPSRQPTRAGRLRRTRVRPARSSRPSAAGRRRSAPARCPPARSRGCRRRRGSGRCPPCRRARRG